jgi:hypothetical protein
LSVHTDSRKSMPAEKQHMFGQYFSGQVIKMIPVAMRQ